jgi:hypothetical protein
MGGEKNINIIGQIHSFLLAVPEFELRASAT